MGMKRAWYLRLDESQTPTAAILVGDRSRVRLLQDLMSDVRVLNEDRGLLTVVGNYKGTQIIVVAFGMGAPIAAVVAHELVDLGVRTIVRLGTMIRLGATQLGDVIVASEALSRDGTSGTYRPGRSHFYADADLTSRLADASASLGAAPKVGRSMSVDGFYTEMMRLRDGDAFPVPALHDAYVRQGCIGLDMETAALFAIGEAFSVAVGCVCMATVDGLTKDKMQDADRVDGESLLARIGLEALVEGTR
jgi:uridine phosphorylase